VRLAFFAIAALILASTLPGAGADLIGHPSVIDGDTIELHGTRIRLFGIDAPESRQSCSDAVGHSYRCGQKAAFALADHIDGGAVSCDPRDIDHYGRTVAVCYLGYEDLNAWMVAQGWALAYRRYSTDYVPQEDAAHAAQLGIWAGSFVPPWDWRKLH
jgi:endonuclease YncB( thermonuclease family)